MARKTKARIADERLFKAMSHWIRVDALRILNERVASPSELAKELNVPVTLVSHHIKVLRDSKYVELVKTEPRRGAVEHYYRATSPALVTDETSRNLPKSARESISVTMLEAISEEASESLRAGTFDEREDRHVSWMPILVDEQGWGELMEMLADSLEAAERIKAASAERLTAADEAGFPTMVAMMGFEMAGEKKKVGPPKKR